MSLCSYGVVIDEDEEATFSYTFTPAQSLRPPAFSTALTVFYYTNESGPIYSSTFYNGTCEIVEPEGIDTELILMVSG